MSLADAATYSLHLLFAAAWVGSVFFVTLVVLPMARNGTLNATPLDAIIGRLQLVSRASALLLLLTGGHMAGTRYTVESLTGSERGHAVLAMVALWFLLAALVEVGSARVRAETGDKKVRKPAREQKPLFYAATLVGALLLVDAGLLSSGVLV
jgi:uncharacterized membrane protein